MSARALRWTEHAVAQLAAIAEYISIASPVYAEQIVERVVGRLEQACTFPTSGRIVPELQRAELRELLEPPYRLIYRVQPEAITVVAVLHSRQGFSGLP